MSLANKYPGISHLFQTGVGDTVTGDAENVMDLLQLSKHGGHLSGLGGLLGKLEANFHAVVLYQASLRHKLLDESLQAEQREPWENPQ